jgi:hypothetical protein
VLPALPTPNPPPNLKQQEKQPKFKGRGVSPNSLCRRKGVRLSDLGPWESGWPGIQAPGEWGGGRGSARGSHPAPKLLMAAVGGASGPGEEPGPAPPLPALGGARAAAPCPALRGATGSHIPGSGVLIPGSFWVRGSEGG